MTAAAPVRRGQLSPRAKRKALAGWAFVVPALLIYAFFFVQPFFYSIYYSLTDWNGADPVKQFVGLGNYIKLAGDSLLWQALGHNLIWVIIGTVSPIAIGLLLGVLIWTGALGRVLFRTIYFLPVVLSEVVIAIIWNWIYHPLFGAVNQILRGIGLDHLARGWLGDPQTALLALLMTAIWSYYGFCFVIIMAGLQNVDISLVEAATIDGANGWQRFIHVIVPQLSHVLTMITAFTLIGGFNVFGIVFVMTQGGPGTATQVIATYTYRKAFQESQVGYGAALSMVMTLLSLATSYIFIRLRERQEQ
ncbi:MAG: sugar ABC transporter permease [Caldilineaceae bacterium]|uniref:Sugar ABC transporter permease n=1 Tax=Caldilineaceae bacterium SB0675_bin_29 TaxID=2605266 RepID=A0A6B1G3F7_9CHLR|nr:sugar ABC transporter permease [Caldilineaceae bacterium]MYH62937.1 sugar ABC transporter permease [Caldilineaceae bacterium SB0675_bin_29]